MNWTILKTEEDYKRALSRMDDIFGATKDSKENDEFNLLLLLINAYEDKHHKIDDVDPIELIKLRMNFMDLKQKDLIPILGSKSTVSKILNYNQPLKLEHIWRLSTFLDIRIEDLAQPYGDFHQIEELTLTPA